MFMQKTNALQLRQNMGGLIEKLRATGEPILLEKDRVPVGVIISIDDYKKRFVDVDADIARREIVEKIKAAKIKLPKGKSSLDLIRDLRTGAEQ
jgi:PHD/YefM family antitoxin component YafN of YafNO toxin-antitoxin module